MEANPKKPVVGKTYTFEAIPEDEAVQEELNRRLRKPGEVAPAPTSGDAAANGHQPTTGCEPHAPAMGT